MQDPSPQGPPNATAPYIEDHTSATTTPTAGAGMATGAISKDDIQDDSDARRLPTVYFLHYPTTVPPAIQGKTTTSTPPLMYAAPPCDYKRRRRASFRRDASGRDPSSLTLRHPYSPRSTPLLAGTWEPSSLSRLACIPYYKHSGCKIIQCPRTPPFVGRTAPRSESG